MTNFKLIDKSGSDLSEQKTVQFKYSIQYEREKTALKYYMIGKGYIDGIKALGFIERLEFDIKPEDRYRKDGITPSLHHQVRIALSVIQLKGLSDIQEQMAIVSALLHDSQEDHGVDREEIDRNFGNIISQIIWKLTKKFAGKHKNKEEYIHEISQDLISAIVKGLDRCDNLEHMIGIFNTDKIDQYSTEAEKVFLPMLKTAMKLYPICHNAFQSIMLRMKHQIKMSKEFVKKTRDYEEAQNTIKNLQHDLYICTQQNKTLINEKLELLVKVEENISNTDKTKVFF